MIHKWQESRIIIKFNLSIIIIDNKSFFLNEETSNSKISNVNDNNITNGEYKNFIWNFINRYAVINVAWSRRTEKNFLKLCIFKYRDSKTVRLEKLRSKYSKLYHPPCPSFYCFFKNSYIVRAKREVRKLTKEMENWIAEKRERESDHRCSFPFKTELVEERERKREKKEEWKLH